MKPKRQPPLASVIKRRREHLALTQRELADAVGVHHPEITGIEQGRRLIPSWRIRSFATALDLPVDELLAAVEATRARMVAA